jgi:tetratricopeptide (TPR) repeat protein
VIPYAAYVLERAGLWDEARALLQANLARSVWPYYLMSQLGGLERRLGRKDEALRWYAQAFEKSQGPATRLQWGAAYLRALVDLAPAQGARIEATARQLLAEAGQDSGAFYKRSGRSLQRAGRALQDWNKDGREAARMKRLGTQLQTLCRRVEAADGQQERCRGLLGAGPKAAG